MGGNWHLLKESELKELIQALGGTPEETCGLSQSGLVAALTTRLVVHKCRVASRAAPAFNRSAALAVQTSHESSWRRPSGYPPELARPKFLPGRHTDSRGATLEEGRRSYRQEHPKADHHQQRPSVTSRNSSATQPHRPLTSDDIGAMERACRLQLQREAAGTRAAAPDYAAGASHMEQKLRWYEESVLDAGTQIDSMVQHATLPTRAPTATPTQPHEELLSQQQSMVDEFSARYTENAPQWRASERYTDGAPLMEPDREPSLVDDLSVSSGSFAKPFVIPDEIAAGAASHSKHVDLASVSLAMEFSENFSQMERQLDSTASSITEACEAAAINDTIDAIMRGDAVGEGNGVGDPFLESALSFFAGGRNT
jgi:hypothetical protein